MMPHRSVEAEAQSGKKDEEDRAALPVEHEAKVCDEAANHVSPNPNEIGRLHAVQRVKSEMKDNDEQ